MTNTPWGKSQHQRKVERGLTFHTTASHGGWLISKGFAEKRLTKAAIRRGLEWNGYIAFEEDVDADIILFELKEARTEVFGVVRDYDREDAVFKRLSRWHPDYLVELKYEPDPEEYHKYLIQKQEESMRKNKSPDLIIFAIRDTFDSGVTIVGTADGKRYRVTDDSYKATNVWLPLLSECVIVSESHFNNSIWEQHFNEKWEK